MTARQFAERAITKVVLTSAKVLQLLGLMSLSALMFAAFILLAILIGLWFSEGYPLPPSWAESSAVRQSFMTIVLVPLRMPLDGSTVTTLALAVFLGIGVLELVAIVGLAFVCWSWLARKPFSDYVCEGALSLNVGALSVAAVSDSVNGDGTLVLLGALVIALTLGWMAVLRRYEHDTFLSDFPVPQVVHTLTLVLGSLLILAGSFAPSGALLASGVLTTFMGLMTGWTLDFFVHRTDPHEEPDQPGVTG